MFLLLLLQFPFRTNERHFITISDKLKGTCPQIHRLLFSYVDTVQDSVDDDVTGSYIRDKSLKLPGRYSLSFLFYFSKTISRGIEVYDYLPSCQ
jgi:hypothetical protein